jgi:hypothetical protein
MGEAARKLKNDGPDAPPANPAPANEAEAPVARPLTPEQRLARSRALIEDFKGTWPDLVAQTAEARKGSSGKNAARMMAPLRGLFRLAAAPEWAAVFGALGVSQDAEHHVPFHATQLLARADRYAALEQLRVELLALTALVSDDLLHQGAQLVTAGKPAIRLARTLAKTNPVFRGKVADVLNQLTAMTAGTRSGAAASEEGVEDESDGEDDGADDDEGESPDPKPDA